MRLQKLFKHIKDFIIGLGEGIQKFRTYKVGKVK
jgi:hypothetical protein